MADLVNLRQARKRKRRDDKEREAAAKRVLHGRTAAEKARSRLEQELGEKSLDEHMRDLPGDIPRDGE